MKSHRPVNLDLFAFAFPLTAITSILHRISGVCIFLGLPLVLWALDASLESSVGFYSLGNLLSLGLVKFFVWIYLVALTYHLVAGVKHLYMDCGFAETAQGGRIASMVLLFVTCVLAVLLGLWIF